LPQLAPSGKACPTNQTHLLLHNTFLQHHTTSPASIPTSEENLLDISKTNPSLFPSYLFGQTVIDVNLKKILTKKKERKIKIFYTSPPPQKKMMKTRRNYTHYNMQISSTSHLRVVQGWW
jgi:hypothetical protein